MQERSKLFINGHSGKKGTRSRVAPARGSPPSPPHTPPLPPFRAWLRRSVTYVRGGIGGAPLGSPPRCPRATARVARGLQGLTLVFCWLSSVGACWVQTLAGCWHLSVRVVCSLAVPPAFRVPSSRVHAWRFVLVGFRRSRVVGASLSRVWLRSRFRQRSAFLRRAFTLGGLCWLGTLLAGCWHLSVPGGVLARFNRRRASGFFLLCWRVKGCRPRGSCGVVLAS